MTSKDPFAGPATPLPEEAPSKLDPALVDEAYEICFQFNEHAHGPLVYAVLSLRDALINRGETR